MTIKRKLPGFVNFYEQLARGTNEAIDKAESATTKSSGSIGVQHSDGSYSIFGAIAGTDDTNTGRSSVHIGDTIAPGFPTGISVSSVSGVLVVDWDGTLDGGVPDDFHHMTVYMAYGGNTYTLGEAVCAMGLTSGSISSGTSVEVWATAEDDNCNEDGSPNHNVSGDSEHFTVVITDTAAEVEKAVDDANAEIATVKGDISAFKSDVSTNYSTKKERKDGDDALLNKLTTEYTNTADADAKYAVESEVKQTTDEISATVSSNYTDLNTKASAAKSAADAAQSTANTAKTNAATAQSTADAAKTSADKANSDISSVKTDYATKAEVKTTTDEISASVEDSLTEAKTYSDGKVAEEVTNRNAAISTKASEIISEVSASYQVKGDYATNDGVAVTYATKASLKQTSDALESEVTARKATDSNVTELSTKVTQNSDSIVTVIGEVQTAQTTADDATIAASNAQTTANSANTKATALSTLIRESTAGVEVGKSSDGSTYSTARTLQGTDGTFQVLGPTGDSLASFGASNSRVGISSKIHTVQDSDSFDIVDSNQKILSTFTPDGISFYGGTNSSLAEIGYKSVDGTAYEYLQSKGPIKLQAGYHASPYMCASTNTGLPTDSGIGLVYHSDTNTYEAAFIADACTYNGRPVTSEILWTIPNINQKFLPQTISLPSNNYNLFAIMPGAGYNSSILLPTLFIKKGQTGIATTMSGNCGWNEGSLFFGIRQFTVASDGQSVGVSASSWWTADYGIWKSDIYDNVHVYPYYIVGIG